MDKLLRNAFIQQIASKEGFDFEEFIDELFMLKYGTDDYIPIRRNKDKGNDGTILPEKKVLACYAPRKYAKIDFETKVLGGKNKEGDFEKYQKNWKEKYECWEMYVNHEIAPEQLNLIEKLDGNTSIKGINQILMIIDDLPSSKRRKLAAFLGIEDFFKQDYIEDILNDLLSGSFVEHELLEFNKRNLTDIADKVKINFSEEDIDGVHSELVLLMPDFQLIENLLSGYEDDEKNILKFRVIDDYNKLSGSFKDRVNNLTAQYIRQYGITEDDEYRKYAKSVLFYMFEQCLIGKKTIKET